VENLKIITELRRWKKQTGKWTDKG